MGYSFRLTARVLLYAPSHRQDSTYHSLCYTSHGVLAGTRNSSMGSPWRIDLTTQRTMSEHSYHGATSRSSDIRNLIHTAIRLQNLHIFTWFLFFKCKKSYWKKAYVSTQFDNKQNSDTLPASAPRLVQQRLWYVLSCLSRPLPFVWRHNNHK